jgi:hypothetical protein
MDTSKLDKLLNKKISDLRDFRQNQEGLWQLVHGGYLVCEELIRSAAILPELTIQEKHRVMMWWTVLDYQMESFFLCINRQLDVSVATLRVASEWTRDLARIGNDEAKMTLWLNRTDSATQKKYRREFRFDDSDDLEKGIHRLYDLASNFGVHGHTRALRPIKSLENGKYVVLDVPDVEVFKCLEIWLAVFYPLQGICSRRFVLDRTAQLAGPYKHFQNMWNAFDPLFDAYRANLRKQNADVIGTLY